MQLIDPTGLGTFSASAVAVGSFDGVHRGHQRLLKALRTTADRAGLQTVLVTFDPIPRAVVDPKRAPPLICSVQTRLRLLQQTGYVDHCCVLPFGQRMKQQTVDEFIIGTLVRRFGMQALVVGENFACGSGRKGDVAYLAELGKKHRFFVEAQPIHTPSGVSRCSSSETRRLIQSGDLSLVAQLLDRTHEMTGVVLDGEQTAARTTLDAVLDENLCTPPQDYYIGTVRVERDSGPWKKAVLRISDAMSRGRRIVQLALADQIRIGTGEALTMRFVRRA